MNGNGGTLSYDNGAYDVSVQIQKGEIFFMWNHILNIIKLKSQYPFNDMYLK